MGLWLAQQCRATWAADGQQFTYEELAHAAEQAEPFRSLIDPDAPEFLPPGDMPARIRAYCARTSQPVPETIGQVMRCVYESLALKYRWSLEAMIRISGHAVSRLHVVGGGTRNRLLCQMTADAIGFAVVTGPAEATVLGNAIVQLIARGELESIAQARRVLAETVGTETYQPRDREQWQGAFARFAGLMHH